MRIGELSRRTGVSVPTIKYYVREGLLPPGELSRPNQASYGAEHERRLRLIRALIEVGGVSVGRVREVVQAVSEADRPVHKALGVVQHSITRPVPDGANGGGELDEAHRAAAGRVTALLDGLGWAVSSEHPSARVLVEAIAAMHRLGYTSFADRLEEYAAASELIARADLASVADVGSTAAMAEAVVVGTLLGDSALGALRRLAQRNASAGQFGEGVPRAAPPADDC
ncbi:MerR family transcriptional regulator [Streptomyces sp. 549]|uniref:MerR family transcriptional regulator n=1 Tax=Streptomyces sp. 549 TaxID=3049076 RepID=UPI0024C311D5|nr:MerR family transcriptional regulator [Streptomyces sp. 549]MDK1473520.1 MerR family transcriptional regulator [Streptomyces sp. 549]